MKKILLLITALFVIQFSQAQKLITFGPMAGLTSSMLDHSDVANSKPGTGYALGGFIRGDIKKFYIQPAIYYVHNTSTFDFNQSNIDTKMNNINADLLLGYRIFKFTDLTYVRIFAGPSYSNISSFKYDGGKPDYSSDNILLNVGAGWDVWKLTFDLRYQQGLTDIDKTSSTLYTNVFMLTAGFKIL